MLLLAFRLCVLILGVMAAAYLVPGIAVETAWAALEAAALLAFFNIVIKPVLITLTLPVTILTLGLFTLVINGFILYLVGNLIPGFTVTGFSTAVLGAAVISLISIFLNLFRPRPAA